MKLTAIAALLLMLGGCVSYEWYKPGTTREEQERQEVACEAAALKALPPNHQVSRESSSTTGSTNCEAGVKDSCGKKNKLYTTTDYTSADINADARYTLIKDCMLQQGWREIEIRH